MSARSQDEIEREARAAYVHSIEALNRSTDREMAESLARRQRARVHPRALPRIQQLKETT
jgi:hypothetical protein